MYLDTMQNILSATSKVVVDQKGGQNLLYLPLDKLDAEPPGPRSRRRASRRPDARARRDRAAAAREPALARRDAGR
jgi:membrane protease subunit HflK